MDIRAHNRDAWNKQVEYGNEWTVPVSAEMVTAARHGLWEIFLTPSKPVPPAWFPSTMMGQDVLCLASGGGQQGPLLAATGARVTVFDNSPRQLAQDRLVAEREGLVITTVEGDMADLSAFGEASFDLIVHPVSNVFAPQVRPVWAEAFRVLRSGGALLAGFMNPAMYIFDLELAERTGELQVKHPLPYADIISLTEEQKQRYIADGSPFEFSHTLDDQIGGQLEAGFMLISLYEDSYGPQVNVLLSRYMPLFIATRAIKP
jgi:SAM-dependent methyltransferase